VTLYVDNPNGTQAAIAAGYAPRSAHVTASRLLKRAKIKDAIARRNAEIMAELDFTPARIVREIAKVAGVNMADFVSIDDEGNPQIDLSGVKRRQLAAVSAVEGRIIEEGRVVKAPKIRTHDKLKALDMLAKLARMYPAELTGVRWRTDSIRQRKRAQDRHRQPRARAARASALGAAGSEGEADRGGDAVGRQARRTRA
jgi:phage terminase small subunit